MKMDKVTYEILINMPQYEEGMNARCGGMNKGFNPHQQDTSESIAWDLGWIEADEQSE